MWRYANLSETKKLPIHPAIAFEKFSNDVHHFYPAFSTSANAILIYFGEYLQHTVTPHLMMFQNSPTIPVKLAGCSNMVTMTHAASFPVCLTPLAAKSHGHPPSKMIRSNRLRNPVQNGNNYPRPQHSLSQCSRNLWWHKSWGSHCCSEICFLFFWLASWCYFYPVYREVLSAEMMWLSFLQSTVHYWVTGHFSRASVS